MWEELAVLALAPQLVSEPTGDGVQLLLSTEPGIRTTGLGKSLGSGWKPWKSLSAPATQYGSPALGTEEEGDMSPNMEEKG